MMVCGIDRIEIYFEELSVRKVLCFSVDTESEEAGEREVFVGTRKENRATIGTVETVHIPQAPRFPPPVSRQRTLLRRFGPSVQM